MSRGSLKDNGHVSILRQADAGVVVRVRVQPRASRAEIVGQYGEQLRVRLTAPPVDQAANKALTNLIAKALGVRRSQVSLLSGHKSRDKQVLVADLSVATARQALDVVTTRSPP